MMRLRQSLRPVIDPLRGDQLKPTVILFVSALLMLTWKYFGSAEYYLGHFHSGGPNGESAIATDGLAAANEARHDAGMTESEPRHPPLVLGHFLAAGYRFATGLVLLGVVPALVVKLAFGERLADYGVQWGDRLATARWFLLLAPVFVLAAYFAAGAPAITKHYPVNKSAGASPATFALHAVTYLMFYVGWEFHFRGFLQFGLREKFGPSGALLVQVMASTLLHVDHPCTEAYGAILGGILWGVIAYRTRSLLSGLLQHWLLGIALDGFILLRSR